MIPRSRSRPWGQGRDLKVKWDEGQGIIFSILIKASRSCSKAGSKVRVMTPKSRWRPWGQGRDLEVKFMTLTLLPHTDTKRPSYGRAYRNLPNYGTGRSTKVRSDRARHFFQIVTATHQYQILLFCTSKYSFTHYLHHVNIFCGRV